MVTMTLGFLISMVANAVLAKKLAARRASEAGAPSRVIPASEPVVFALSADALVWEAEAAVQRRDFAAARSYAEQALMLMAARRAPASAKARARAVLQRALWPGLANLAVGRRPLAQISDAEPA